ncbi:hypothetical protein JVT61DRAFT_11369 [Boletus reticuloceps]|uniref:Uncharacterized protein n=1 Tax=Boletus reticuloceps TaxID=495285 RepID=A0A8I2YF58_9AGAM|nr:hypothetical protein JVT61DRAFT_11369 [Boletus reticuloceps]
MPLSVSSSTIRAALAYGPICAQVSASTWSLNDLAFAKYIGRASNSSTALSTDVTCIQDIPAGSLALASYDLRISWDIVVDGDYVLDDIASSIRDCVYARIPTLWSATECDYCYFLPSTLSPTASPATYVQKLPRYFNQIQIAKILNETTLYPYNTTPSKGGMCACTAVD